MSHWPKAWDRHWFPWHWVCALRGHVPTNYPSSFGCPRCGQAWDDGLETADGLRSWAAAIMRYAEEPSDLTTPEWWRHAAIKVAEKSLALLSNGEEAS